MKFSYLSDGTVTGMNRAGILPELTGHCGNNERVYGMHCEYYTASGGVLTPMSNKEVLIIQENINKKNAYDQALIGILTKKRNQNDKPFEYETNFFEVINNGKQNIESMHNICLTLGADDKIPTFPVTAELAGKWVTTDRRAIAFTASEFIIFATKLVYKYAWNFDVEVQHGIAISALMTNANSTSTDIIDYDFSQGWM